MAIAATTIYQRPPSAVNSIVSPSNRPDSNFALSETAIPSLLAFFALPPEAACLFKSERHFSTIGQLLLLPMMTTKQV